MTLHTMASKADSVPTLPRLLAVNKDFSNLDEQIVQVAHIIGLPKTWTSIQDGKERSDVIQQLARPRAEWVLRWALDKLGNEAELGADARANPTLWNLVDWMVHVLPTSRAATQLRDSGFLIILEKALQENSERDVTEQPAISREEISWSESSETAQEESRPSRKRKRPSSGTSTPSKSEKRSRQPSGLVQLFEVIATATQTLANKTCHHRISAETSQTEHMKMALRTESAQAARIIKYWFTTVQKIMANSMVSLLPDPCKDISSVLEVWDLRIMEAGDQYGASAEQFSTECLIPTLLLLDTTRKVIASQARPEESLTNSLQILETLIAKHIFVPSRTAFQAHAAASKPDSRLEPLRAGNLASNLEPLRAKLLQAAQILDTSEPIPSYFIPLFHAVPQLLDIAIRVSPSRTPKVRIAEQPWLQGVFVALAECVGCPLEAPAFVIPQPSIDALRDSINLLQVRGIRIDSALVVGIFWFHTGVKYPLQQPKSVQWPLIAALIELDATAFIGKSASKPTTLDDQRVDLVQFLFDQISSLGAETYKQGSIYPMDLDDEEGQFSHMHPPDQEFSNSDRDSILSSIIVPVMSAFARNRDLLGFIHRWDDQLVEHALAPLRDLSPSIWESHTLSLALAHSFEQSLTRAQIITLVQEHAERVKPIQISEDSTMRNLSPDQSLALKKGYSSAVLIRAMLWSVDSDMTLEALQPALVDVLISFTFIVRDTWQRNNIELQHYWITLSQVLNVLWPMHLHGSLEQQQELLLPAISRATKDVSHARKKDETRIDSRTRSAALLFLLTASDHLRTVDGWEGQLQESLKKGLKLLSPGRLEPDDLHKLLGVFCTEYAQLLNSVQYEHREKSVLALLSSISALDEQSASPLVDELSQTIITFASQPTKDAFSSALLTALSQSNDNAHLTEVAEAALLQIRPEAFSRQRREEMLNVLTDTLLEHPEKAAPLLRIMSCLMKLPNATARISSDGGVLFDIVECLHKSKTDALDVTRLFQELASSTLGHTLPNRDQLQNQRFLDEYEKKLSKSSKSPYKYSPAMLALLSGTLLVQKEYSLLSWDSYLTLLDDCLNDAFIADRLILEAYADIPSEVLQNNAASFTKAQTSLRVWLEQRQGPEDVLSSFFDTAAKPRLAIDRVCLLRILSKYRLCSNTDMERFLSACTTTLQGQLSGTEIAAVLQSVRSIIAALSASDRLALISRFLVATAQQDFGVSYSLLPILISTLGDGLEDDALQRNQQLSVLPRLCGLLVRTGNTVTFNSLLDAVNIMVRDKASLTNQNGIECVITTIANLTSRNSPALPCSDAPAFYGRLCETTRLILLLHRGRLGGRFHLLLPLLQNLLFCLFIPHAGRGTSLPAWLRTTTTASQVKLTPTNAAQYARLLLALCSPTQSSVSSKHQRATNTKSTLNDPVKAAKDYASHYVYPLLASFCRFSLSGRLEPVVRDKVITGIWEVIGVADMDRDTLGAMFAGLDKASRDVWRGIWEEWKRLNGRQKVQKGGD